MLTKAELHIVKHSKSKGSLKHEKNFRNILPVLINVYAPILTKDVLPRWTSVDVSGSTFWSVDILIACK